MTRTYNISEMTCVSCEGKVKSVSLTLPYVTSVEVSKCSPKAFIASNIQIYLSELQQALGKNGKYKISDELHIESVEHQYHENKQEAEKHHQHEHTNHQHDGKKSSGHGYASYFIHSADFETYVSSTSFKFVDRSKFHLDLLLFTSDFFDFHSQYFATEVDRLPDLSPPDIAYPPLPNGLRGSPFPLFGA